ncbi:MAG: hypothetical protein CO103_07095 [Chloroflexi bacterium CG_4_9_14_3_um_filter_45_9]|nr:MAG: hypothetical protein COT13_00840 [Chloroflexi bacterium CG08_land_8_20_14_0_20_45_12]PIX27093.1 MAG: hypothetical protein COZ67_04240 [Chloroflexi bacterium CG_4_8_14_3_um_filter_45_15]PJB48676.1 MAG: hypothetical protein CO103_07095 [Chloroflexi bacterium CG_4_9_14_3_um_filter_45_9]
MNKLLTGLESSSLMPLVTITPLSQDCYDTIWGELFDNCFVIHQDSLRELKNIFEFSANTFFSNPIVRMQKLRDISPCKGLTVKGVAVKLLLDGQAGGWIGNKNSRVQAFFFSDVIDSIEDCIVDVQEFCDILVQRMEAKINRFNHLITPHDNLLVVDLENVLPYWGYHNVSRDFLEEDRKLVINVREDSASIDMFTHKTSAARRDAFHYHMLTQEAVDLILVGDANFESNICSCGQCSKRSPKIRILTNKRRNDLLNL